MNFNPNIKSDLNFDVSNYFLYKHNCVWANSGQGEIASVEGQKIGQFENNSAHSIYSLAFFLKKYLSVFSKYFKFVDLDVFVTSIYKIIIIIACIKVCMD